MSRLTVTPLDEKATLADWARHLRDINRLRIKGREWEAFILLLQIWPGMEADLVLYEQNHEGDNEEAVWALFAERYPRPIAKARFMKTFAAIELRSLLGLVPKPEAEAPALPP